MKEKMVSITAEQHEYFLVFSEIGAQHAIDRYIASLEKDIVPFSSVRECPRCAGQLKVDRSIALWEAAGWSPPRPLTLVDDWTAINQFEDKRRVLVLYCGCGCGAKVWMWAKDASSFQKPHPIEGRQPNGEMDIRAEGMYV